MIWLLAINLFGIYAAAEICDNHYSYLICTLLSMHQNKPQKFVSAAEVIMPCIQLFSVLFLQIQNNA
jgi:hypothetical protein